MFRTKTIVALTAIGFISCVSAAFADDADGKISDRYPLLEKRQTPVSTSNVASRAPTTRQIPNSYTVTNDVSDNKIGDRYPFLETRVTAQKTPARTARVRASSTSADDNLMTGSIRSW